MNNISLGENYGTLSQTINELANLGYSHDFNSKDNCTICHTTNITLSPKDFQIDKVYRFEGASDPDYQSILYAISSLKFDVKGILVNGYGISSDEAASKIIEKLQTNQKILASRNKSNDSTEKRPDGDRILNAALVEMDLNIFLKQIKSETAWDSHDRNSITIFKSDSLRIVMIALHENAEMKPHKANGVISVQVLEGMIEFQTERDSLQLQKGQMIALQDNIIHSVKALQESCFLLTLAMITK